MPEGYQEWKDNLDAIPEDQLPSVDLAASWAKLTPAQRRYVIKFDEAWWNGLRALAKSKP